MTDLVQAAIDAWDVFKNMADGSAEKDAQLAVLVAANNARDAAAAGPVQTYSGGGGGYSPPPAPAPIYPKFVPMTQSSTNVLAAPSDIIQFDESSVEVALMQDLLFEDVGAVELANISRSDLIDGQETIYSPIKNLSSVRRAFNPNNIIFTSSNNDYFTRFGIDIFSKTIYEPYFDDAGNLVIEVDGLSDEEEIQVQILADGTISVVEAL